MTKFTALTNIHTLSRLLPDITTLATNVNSALGLPVKSTIRDAIEKNRLIALVGENSQNFELAGYVLWGGIFPNAKIQQIELVKSYRRQGAGAALVTELVQYLEKLRFMTIQADVAEDMTTDLAFYEQNNFYRLRTTNDDDLGGRRKIILIRELQYEPPSQESIDNLPLLSIQTKATTDDPIYLLDPGVYFDLVKQKHLASEAEILFSASLANVLRIAVAKKYAGEMLKTYQNLEDQPIYQIAKDLPRLTEPDSDELRSLTTALNSRIFVQQDLSNVSRLQSLNDATNLAHAILGRALAFVTSNNEILRQREILINEFGIDVVSIDDLLELLPSRKDRLTFTRRKGSVFAISEPTLRAVSEYYAENNVGDSLKQEFGVESSDAIDCWRRCFQIDGKTCGVAVLLTPTKPNRTHRLAIHFREDNWYKFLFAEHLFDLSLQQASKHAVTSIVLELSSRQPTLAVLAHSKGFITSTPETLYRKIAIGRPVTKRHWPEIVQETQRSTRFAITGEMPSKRQKLQVKNLIGNNMQLSQFEFEKLFTPTVIAWGDRDGVIVPIKPFYSKELLEVSPPLSKLFDMDVKYFSRRTYVNSSRNASKMQAGAPIFFYESKGPRRLGAGAIIAVARIINAVINPKYGVIREMESTSKVSDENILQTRNVVVTSFDNIFRFENPISLERLKRMGAANNANLVSAQAISAELVNRIIDLGFDNE